MTRASVAAVIGSLALAPIGAPDTDRFTRAWMADRSGEARAVVRAGCERCDWGESGREAVVLRVSLDGKYSQHIVLTRGEAANDYYISLGRIEPGLHRLAVERDPTLSATATGPATVDVPSIDTLVPGTSNDFTAQSMAPILYARPNTVGRFTDVPLFMWYEIVPTARGRQYRYSVVFSNEDGGTPTDRLMATWGRTTDIEFVYGVELDEHDAVLAEEYQGPGHEVPAFKGQHEARHPLQWVSTDNNMVSEAGSARVRYALVPEKFDLTDTSREAVMDAHPWLYAVMAKELGREGKIVPDAPPGNKQIPDPRRFVYIEACADVGRSALAFALNVGGRWLPSDRGMPQYRITRDGCARAAVPLPDGATGSDIRALRVVAYARAGEDGTPEAVATPVHLTRINQVFSLRDDYTPGETRLRWTGSETLTPGAAPFEVRIP